ncbi:hypothetical protein ACIQFP_10525 [Nocardiopsis alba]|uniref:hypothetical protein n=1 Tax=Nocardiopsis alba TaxID=53437 RepID=UPI00380A7580
MYELAVNPGSLHSFDRRTTTWLLDAGLIEWCETTDYCHVYRATDAAHPILREHLEFLETRESKGRMYRSDSEQDFQIRAAHYRTRLDDAVNEERPETPADRADEIWATEHAAERGLYVDQLVTGDLRGTEVRGRITRFYMSGDLGLGRDFRIAMAVVRDEATGRDKFMDVPSVTAVDEVPAELPKRDKANPGTAIADAARRFRTPLPTVRVGTDVTITTIPDGRRVSGTVTDMYTTVDGEVDMVAIADRRGGVPRMGMLATTTPARVWGPGPWRYEDRASVSLSCETDPDRGYRVSLRDNVLSIGLVTRTFATLADRDEWLSDALYDDQEPADAA